MVVMVDAMSYVNLHLSCLALLGLAFIIVAAIHCYRFGQEIKADRAESTALYARLRRERFESMTQAEQEACREYL